MTAYCWLAASPLAVERTKLYAARFGPVETSYQVMNQKPGTLMGMVWGGILLAAGPALIRSARPYGTAFQSGFVILDVAPFLLALLYLVFLSRRSLRLAASPQARTDPDVL